MLFDITALAFILTTPYFWLFVGLLFLVLETATPGLFYFLSFSIAAAITAISSIIFSSPITQLCVFIFSIVLSLYILRSWLQGKMQSNNEVKNTNAEAIKGKTGIVVERISPNTFGQVKINGEIWSARPLHAVEIEKGALVKITGIKGAHVIVISQKKETIS